MSTPALDKKKIKISQHKTLKKKQTNKNFIRLNMHFSSTNELDN
jgi:hypothetical protein